MAQYVLINTIGTRRAGEIIDTVQDPGVVPQLAAFGGVLIPLPSVALQPYIEAAQLAYDRAQSEEAQDIMMAGYASSTSIAGGGTPDFVPIWTAGAVLGDSVIKQSGSLVGINVAAPTAALSLPAGALAAASMNFATGVAPGAPNAGDLWFDGTYLYLRAAGINQPLNAPFGTGTPNVLTKWSSVSGLTDTAITEASGAIRTLTLTGAGAGATNGTYSQQALTGGTGAGATADIVVAGNVVTSLVLRNPGTGYTAGDALSCATIGGGGFVFTVSAVSASDNASGNVTGARLGAGVASPLSGVDSVLGIVSRTAQPYVAQSTATNTLAYSNIVIDSSGEPSGSIVAPAGALVAPLRVQPRIDASSSTASVSVYGAWIQPHLQAATSAGTTSLFALLSSFRFSSPSLTAKTITAYGVQATLGVFTGIGAGNTFSVTSFLGGPVCSATAAQTFTSFTDFYSSPFFSGAAHNVAVYYNARFVAPSLGGGATMASRWGVSQEDPAARSAYYGNVGVGNALDVGAGKVIASLTLTNGGTGYTNGTYSQVALTTTTGSGSGATADIVVAGGIVTTVVLRNPGQGYAVGDTLSCASIGAGTSFLLTVATTASILRSDGTVVGSRIGAGTTAPTAALHTSGGAVFDGYRLLAVDNGAPAFSNNLWSTQALLGGQGTASVPTNNLTTQLFVSDKFDVRSVPTAASTYGARFVNRLFASNVGQTVNVFGIQVFCSRDQASNDDSTTVTQIAVVATANANQASGTTTALIGVQANTSSFVAGHTVTTATQIDCASPTVAGTIVTFYGIRLRTPSVTGTITNRYPISQEDTLGTNFVRAKTHFGAAVGTAAATTASIEVTAQGALNGSIRLNSANAVVDVSAASSNGVLFNNRGGAGITSTTQNWYEEGTYTPTLSAGWTVTAGNYAGYWTRVGRLVTLTIQFTGGTTSGATGGATISTPVGLVPARNGAGTAVNANGTALGNGVVVVTTAQTIINANAITSTTVDKTIVVQYEV